jgi:hypothetical protein
MFIRVYLKKDQQVHFGFMNIILLHSDHRHVVTVYYSYIHKTKMLVLVFLIKFVHVINARNVERKLNYVSSSFPYFIICRISR